MSCGCSDRMRRHILPTFGFALKDGYWINMSFPEEKYRIIPDEDVEKHYTYLTVQLALLLGKERFGKFFRRIYKVNDSDDEVWERVEDIVNHPTYDELKRR